MPQHFTCPHCAETTLVAEQFAGSRGPCAHCGREIEIPAALTSPYARSVRPRASWGISAKVERLIAIVLAVTVSGALSGLVVWKSIPYWQEAKLNSQKRRCRDNLQTIVAALRAYESEHGHLPPAYVVDDLGRPLYSWRVSILPYLGWEEKQLYQRFHLSEPWDSATNVWLAREMPDVFASPLDPDAESFHQSSYRVITGPGTFFPDPPATASLTDLKDRAAETLLVVSCKTSGTKSWTQPDELDSKTMTFCIGDGSAMQLGGNDSSGVNVAFADGSVGFVPASAASPILKALASIAKGEIIPEELMEYFEE